MSKKFEICEQTEDKFYDNGSWINFIDLRNYSWVKGGGIELRYFVELHFEPARLDQHRIYDGRQLSQEQKDINKRRFAQDWKQIEEDCKSKVIVSFTNKGFANLLIKDYNFELVDEVNGLYLVKRQIPNLSETELFNLRQSAKSL